MCCMLIVDMVLLGISIICFKDVCIYKRKIDEYLRNIKRIYYERDLK